MAVRALLSRSPSTSTRTRVESSPRSRGRTWKGPSPTGVIPGNSIIASPVEVGIRSWSWASLIDSARSGISSVSRALRAAVTITSAVSPPTESAKATSSASSEERRDTVRASWEKPGCTTEIR